MKFSKKDREKLREAAEQYMVAETEYDINSSDKLSFMDLSVELARMNWTVDIHVHLLTNMGGETMYWQVDIGHPALLSVSGKGTTAEGAFTAALLALLGKLTVRANALYDLEVI